MIWHFPSKWTQLLPPILMTIVGVTFLFWSYTYGPDARMFPVIIGWTWIVLSGLDIIASSGTQPGKLVATFFTGQVFEPAKEKDMDQSGLKTVISVGWVVAFIIAVYYVGFLPVIPVYIFLFVVLQGGKSIISGAISGIATVTLIWIVFVEIFNYPIFKGIFFENIY